MIQNFCPSACQVRQASCTCNCETLAYFLYLCFMEDQARRISCAYIYMWHFFRWLLHIHWSKCPSKTRSQSTADQSKCATRRSRSNVFDLLVFHVWKECGQFECVCTGWPGAALSAGLEEEWYPRAPMANGNSQHQVTQCLQCKNHGVSLSTLKTSYLKQMGWERTQDVWGLWVLKVICLINLVVGTSIFQFQIDISMLFKISMFSLWKFNC